MKRMIMIIVCMLLFPISVAIGSSDPDTGEKYFYDTSLGTNGKSCASCHADGKGLEEAGDYDMSALKEIINFCIRDALKGKMLPADDPKLAEIEKYIRQFYRKQ